MNDSILDHPAISGNYLFPQARKLRHADPIEVEDGVSLNCYHHVESKGRKTLVHFHGNGEAVADYVPDMAECFANLGLNSLFIEYRDYGGSGGEAKLTTMLADGERAIRDRGLAPESIIVFGRSIGSLYAIELAHRMPDVAGLVLESGIAAPLERFLARCDLRNAGISESDVAAEVKRHFDHEKKLGNYKQPLLVLHAQNDGLVEYSHAERNLEWAASSCKDLVGFEFGNHNTIFAVNYQEYLNELKNFIELLD